MRLTVIFVLSFLMLDCSTENPHTVGEADHSAQSKAQKPGTEPLRLVRTIPLPNVEGRIDHMDVDIANQRLFVAALGNNTLEVVDLKKGERVASVAGLREPQGLRYLAQSNTIVVANGEDGVTTFLDAASLKTIKTVRFSGDADNVRYDAAHKRVYVGYGKGALGVLNEKGERIGDIPLGGHPESFQLDSTTGKIYINIPDQQEIAVADANTMRVTAVWKVDSASANYPMTLDEAHHRLFVLTRKPPLLLVYNTQTGKIITTLKASGDSDDVFFDSVHGRIYGSFGEGVLMVYEQIDADHYKEIASIPTAAGARTAFFSSELGQLYVAVPHRGNPTAEIRVYQIEP